MEMQHKQGGFPIEHLYLLLLAIADGLIVSNKTSFFLLAEQVYGIDVLEFGYIDNLATLLVCFKPFYGYISDVYTLFGHRRRIYLFIFSYIGILTYGLVAISEDFGFGLYTVISCYLIAEVANNVRAVVNEALCAETHRTLTEREQSQNVKYRFNSLYIMLWGKHCGTILSVFLVRTFFKTLSSRIFFIYVIACTITVVMAAVMHEKKDQKRAAKNIVREFVKSYDILEKNKMLLALCASTIILSAPYVQTLCNYFTRGVLRFNEKLITDRALVSKIFAFLAVFSRSLFLKNVDRSFVLKMTTLLNILMMIFFFFIFFFFKSPSVYGTFCAFLFTGFEAYTTEMRNIPLMEIFVEKSPKDGDGLFISVLAFLNSIAKSISQYLSNLLVKFLHITKTNFVNGPVLIMANILVGLIGYIVLEISYSSVFTHEEKLEEGQKEEPRIAIKNNEDKN